MDQLLAALCFVAFGVMIVTVVGHGLWLLFAAIGRAILGQTQQQSTPRQRRQRRQMQCLRCEFRLPEDVTDCPRCGLDYQGLVAEELADLEATARQFERLRRAEQLPDDVLAQLWEMIEERHERLVGTPRRDVPTTPLAPLPTAEAQPAPKGAEEKPLPVESIEEDIPMVIPVRPAAATATPTGAAVWQRLRQLLAANHENEMTASDRVRAVMWYRQSPAARLQELPIPIQRRLARVLRDAGLFEDALLCYRRCLLDSYHDEIEVAIALEAARLALTHQPEMASEFLDKAGAGAATAEQQREVNRLWKQAGERKEEIAAPEITPRPVAPPKTPQPTKAEAESIPTVTAADEIAPATSEKRSRWVDLLGGFMEEKNILWGELVGGLLIVGGSIALVVSLWNTLQANPYFPFGIFAAITASLFGAGFYTLSHWKLQATSRGLLVIASLLAPLTFLVLPSTLGKSAGGVVELLMAGVAGALFAWFLYRAALVMSPEGRVVLPVALLGSAITPLAAARLSAAPSLSFLFALGFVPVLCQVLSIGWVGWRLRRREPFALKECGSLFTIAGVTTFAAVVAIGFLLVRHADRAEALQQFAPLISLLGVPILLSGLLIHNRLAEAPELSALRTTGTGIALAGVGAMFLALAAAWPQPRVVVSVCAIHFVILTWASFRRGLPLLDAPALFSLLLGYLTIFHIGNGEITLANNPRLIFGTITAGLRLMIAAVALAGVAEFLWRCLKTTDAKYYTGGAAAAALFSLTLASWHGTANPASALVIYAIIGLGFLLVNLRVMRVELSYAGLVLVGGAVLWGMHAWLPEQFSFWALALAVCALLFGLLGVTITYLARHLWRINDITNFESVFVWPFLRCAEAVAIAAIILAGYTGLNGWHWQHAATGGLLVTLYLLLTAKEQRHLTGAMAGFLSVATVVAATEALGNELRIARVQSWIGLMIALSGLALSVIGSILHRLARFRQRASPSVTRWYDVLPLAWREVVVVASVLSLLLSARSPAFLTSSLHTTSISVVAAIAILAALQHRQPVFTWIGSVLLLAAIGHGQHLSSALLLQHQAITALLSHATLMLIGAQLVRRFRSGETAPTSSLRVFAVPYLWSGLISTFLALAIFPVLHLSPLDQGSTSLLTLLIGWLALLWLAASWSRRWPLLFAGFQLVAMATVLYATAAWLETQTWTATNNLAGWWHPWSLQAFGAGLTLLCGAFVVARLTLHRTAAGKVLLLPNWPGVDRWLFGALLLGQLGLVDWAILRDVLMEIAPIETGWQSSWWPAVYSHAYGASALLVFGLLSLVALASLWQPQPRQRQTAALLGAAILLSTFASLVAAGFAGERSVASALRWAMALLFLLSAAPLWARVLVGESARALRMPANDDAHLPAKMRITLFDDLAAPVLVITIVMAALLIAGWNIPGPLRGTFFYEISSFTSLFVPLGLIVVALVGHALREESPDYAFGAGLLTMFSASGGYALSIVQAGGPFGQAQWVMLLQIAGVAAALWACVWLWSRRWIRAWREDGHSPLAQPLMLAQIAMPIAVNLCLLMPAILYLTPPVSWRGLLTSEIWYPASPAWTLAAGGVLGWSALALTALAVFVHQHRAITPPLVGGFALAFIAQCACTVEQILPGQGFRTFLLGLAFFTLGWALLPVLLARRESKAVQLNRFRAAAPWWVSGVASVLALFCLQVIFVHNDHLFGAGLFAVASFAVMMIGYQRRADVALFLGNCGLAVAAALFLWHYQLGYTFDGWVIYLFETLAIILALTALIWLWNFGNDYRRQDVRRQSHLLPVQIFAAVLCGIAPIVCAYGLIGFAPGYRPLTFIQQIVHPSGWVALASVLAALTWLVILARPRYLIHVIGGGGLLLVGQIGATFVLLDGGSWLGYHAVGAGVGIVAISLCLLGGLAGSGRLLGPRFLPAPAREGWTVFMHIAFPARQTRLWVECLGIVLVGIAVRAGVDDPGRPFWSLLVLALACASALGLLLWTRRIAYLHLFGVLIGLGGWIFWLGHAYYKLDAILWTMATCLGIGAIIAAPLEEWLSRMPVPKKQRRYRQLSDYLTRGILGAFVFMSLVLLYLLAAPRDAVLFFDSPNAQIRFWCAAALPVAIFTAVVWALFGRKSTEEIPTEEWERQYSLSFSRPACFVGLNLIAGLVLMGIASDLLGDGLYFAAPPAWAAWVISLGAALVQAALKRSAPSPVAALPLYVVALLGVILNLHQFSPSPQELGRWTAVSVGGFLLLAGASGWCCSFSFIREKVLQRLWLDQPPQIWFVPAQLLFAALTVGLSFWITLSFSELSLRLTGSLALLLLVPALLLLPATATVMPLTTRRQQLLDGLRYTALVAGVLFLLAFAWAWPGPGLQHLALVRHILLLGVLALATVVYGLVVNRMLSAQNRWSECAQNFARILWLGGMFAVLTVTTHEMMVLHPSLSPSPLDGFSIAFVAIVLIAFIVWSIWFAVLPKHDPFALSEFWRMKYVYAAELLVFLLLLHLKLTAPYIFTGPLRRFAPIIIITIAFVGVGLSEWFSRRNLRVLAVPLQRTGVFLPLLPLLTFWLQASGDIWQLILGKKGIQLSEINIADLDFGKYALYWLLAAAVYLLAAFVRQSRWFALFAALAANFAFWSLLYQNRELGFDFVTHPQLWLIPLALIILGAEYVNRDLLPTGAAAGLRYLGLILLYVSSTADLFLTGLNDITMSIVLAVLSVVGILAGILFRVRAFLFVGVSFLLLVIGVRIFYAGYYQEQTWVWWVAVICLGIFILTLFALFEKRRMDMLKMLEELKRWK